MDSAVSRSLDESTHGRRDTSKAFPIPQPSQRVPVIAFLPPPSIFSAVVKYGSEKAMMPGWKTFLLGVLAGVYLSFGCALSYAIGGELPLMRTQNPGLQKLIFGAFGLPFGLALIVICGADLYTANTAFLPAALYEGKSTLLQLLKNWLCCFFGNLAGSLFIVWLTSRSMLFMEPAQKGGLSLAVEYAKDTAVAKTSASFGDTVVRGMLCNWLVSLAYWQATGAQDIIGKIIGVYFPVLAFESMSFDHVIANMYFVPFGMKLGAPVSVGKYIVHNMIPVAIGNTIAGALFVALPYALLYGTVATRISSWVLRLKSGDTAVLPSLKHKPTASKDSYVHHDNSSGHGPNTAAAPDYHPSGADVTQHGSSKDDSAHGIP